MTWSWPGCFSEGSSPRKWRSSEPLRHRGRRLAEQGPLFRLPGSCEARLVLRAEERSLRQQGNLCLDGRPGFPDGAGFPYCPDRQAEGAPALLVGHRGPRGDSRPLGCLAHRLLGNPPRHGQDLGPEQLRPHRRALPREGEDLRVREGRRDPLFQLALKPHGTGPAAPPLKPFNRRVPFGKAL